MSIREQILNRDGGVCQVQAPGCTLHATHIDHIVPLQIGGTDEQSNLRAACAHCNLTR